MIDSASILLPPNSTGGDWAWPASHPPARGRLLVVEDEERLRESVCALLRSRAYEVRACDQGQLALGELMAGGIDLMLLDLHLGDITGLELLEMIRRAGMDTAVLVVSGDTAIDAAIGALRLGATDYVTKPYEPEELLHRVDMAFERRSLQRQTQQMEQQLQSSERIHRFLVDASPDLIFTLDEKFRFTFLNQRATNLIGCQAEALLGQPFLSIVVPGDVERVQYALERVGDHRALEFRIFFNGDAREERHFEASLVPVAGALSRMPGHDAASSRLYGVARDVTEKKAAEDRLAYLAYHDVLTGLPNRTLFRDRLSLSTVQARRNGSMVAVMLVDLDRFKIANDTFGHLKGDELLREVAQRLQGSLRETDTLSRLGGDEFTILLTGLQSKADAARVASKLVAEVAEPFTINRCDVFLTASIGIAIYPGDGEDGETLLRHADLAMYQVKSQGKNGFEFFTPEMDLVSGLRLSLEGEIRRALDQEQFELHFQPQIDFSTGEMIGCEALIRWRHPSRGLVPAGSFLSVIEEIGMMGPLTDWVLETACRALREWRQEGLIPPRMSINVPPAILAEPDFCERIVTKVDHYGIPHASFEIELTENAFIAEQDAVALKLARLSESGIRVAIDDFGTQYSSLSYLRSLPVTTLKIDQSFVREIVVGREDSPIVRAIVAIAQGLGLNLVAEGVETDLQAAYLDSLGVREMQGFLFGKAMPPDELKGLLKRSSPEL